MIETGILRRLQAVTKPRADSRAVFAAPAVHPMVQVGNEWMFDRATFLDRVLELAEADAPG